MVSLPRIGISIIPSPDLPVITETLLVVTLQPSKNVIDCHCDPAFLSGFSRIRLQMEVGRRISNLHLEIASSPSAPRPDRAYVI
jgi:hypothetical protein